MFAGLGNGKLAVFNPHNPSAGHTHLISISHTPILTCVSVGGRLLASSEGTLFRVDPHSLQSSVSTTV